MITPYIQDVMSGAICPYCKSKTRITTEIEVYGRSYKNRALIVCCNFPHCDSYVGTHDDGTALGRLANKELRNQKIKAHDSFDKLWRNGHMKKTRAYEKLAEYMERFGVPEEYCHIGMMNFKNLLIVEDWAMNQLKNPKK